MKNLHGKKIYASLHNTRDYKMQKIVRKSNEKKRNLDPYIYNIGNVRHERVNISDLVIRLVI